MCAHRHNFDMGFPIELIVDEDAKVTNQRRTTNLKSPTAGNPQVDQWLEGSDSVRVGSTRLECDEFHFVRVEVEAIA